MNALRLPGYTVLDVKEDEHDLHYILETVSQPSLCPVCKTVNGDLIGHGRDIQLYMDTPMFGKRVGLHINRRRMYCQDCHSSFQEPLPGMHEKHHATRRLITYIERRVMQKYTFAKIATDVGLSEWTIRSIFNEFTAREQKSYHPVTPRFLGIDEAHLFHNYRCVITDVERRTIIDLLEKRIYPVVVDYLRKMPSRNRIETICMDMWSPYREAVKTVFPGMKIVVDKYHVVRYASDALDAIRKDFKNTLAEKQRQTFKWDRYALLSRPQNLSHHQYLALGHCLTYPLLRLGYELKESFYDLFDYSPNRETAEHGYELWLNRLTPETKPYFTDLMKAMDSWYEEIFSYFNLMPNPVTNAYTEALNGIIKLLNKDGRGYKFSVLRAKILFSEGAHKVVIPKFNKNIDRMANMMSMFVSEPGGYYQIRDHGVDMDTLFNKLVDGSFFSETQ